MTSTELPPWPRVTHLHRLLHHKNGNLYRNCVSGKHGAHPITSHIASVVSTAHTWLRHISLPWWARSTTDYVTYRFRHPLPNHYEGRGSWMRTRGDRGVSSDDHRHYYFRTGLSSPYTFSRLGEREAQVNGEWHLHFLHIYKEVVNISREN